MYLECIYLITENSPKINMTKSPSQLLGQLEYLFFKNCESENLCCKARSFVFIILCSGILRPENLFMIFFYKIKLNLLLRMKRLFPKQHKLWCREIIGVSVGNGTRATLFKRDCHCYTIFQLSQLIVPGVLTLNA